MNYAVLTIDDISSKNTKAIVDYLVKHNIKAVMFAVGKNVEYFYEEAIYAVKAGMIVGNHSYSHPSFNSISYEEAVEEIEKNEKVLDKLYKDAGVERKYRPFRFPYAHRGGENEKRLQEYLLKRKINKLDDSFIDYEWWKENGLDVNIDTFWTFDFEEYRIRNGSVFSEKNVYDKILDSDPKKGGALLTEGNHNIVLIHAHDETEEIINGYFEKYMDYIINNGVTFVEPKFFEAK